MNAKTKVLLSSQEISARVNELASEIAKDYKDKKPLFIGVLNGAYIFLSDLSKALWEKGLREFSIDFVGVSSYSSGRESSRAPTFTKELTINVANRHVVIVEDIIETGYSLKTLIEVIKAHTPASVKTAILLSKPEKKEVDITPDYLGFTIDSNAWVEGYGLDTDEYGRGNPDIVKRLD